MAVTPFQLTEPFSMDNFNSRISEINTMFNGLGNEYVWEKRDSTGIVGYVNSPDPNAYPPAVSDGYTYTPLGRFGSKLKFEYGSYTGTGAGDSHSLTFGVQPELVFIQGQAGTGYVDGVTFIKGEALWISENYGNVAQIRIEYNLGVNMLSIKTISSPYAEYILNESGKVYHYLAIGYDGGTL